MGRRGVEHARAVRYGGDERSRFSGGFVGQAEDDEVDLCKEGALGLDVLAVGVGEAPQLDIGAPGEALADAKPGRPRLAVDEDARRHDAILANCLGCLRSAAQRQETLAPNHADAKR